MSYRLTRLPVLAACVVAATSAAGLLCGVEAAQPPAVPAKAEVPRWPQRSRSTKPSRPA